MQKNFTQFADNIRLTANQETDAKTKYSGVCEKLHSSYYDTVYDGQTKLLFGSYKTKTNVRPITENQDVDVIFKIPKATYEKFKAYESNGPSALLQEVRGFLNEKYTTTDVIKAWGKVVLVKFADKTHNVEVLPAYEEDGKFIIPNTEDGGSWDDFDPRSQISDFQESNRITNGLTADLARMIKTWVDNTTTCTYKSYLLLCDVMKFLETEYKDGASYAEYSKVVECFFKYLSSHCNSDIDSFVKTAYQRAQNARDYENRDMPKEASEEWRKIFGVEFPLETSNPTKKESTTRIFTNPSSPYGKGTVV